MIILQSQDLFDLIKTCCIIVIFLIINSVIYIACLLTYSLMFFRMFIDGSVQKLGMNEALASLYEHWTRTIRPLIKVIITFTFCCHNLWKSKFMALEKPGKLRDFFPFDWVDFWGQCRGSC